MAPPITRAYKKELWGGGGGGKRLEQKQERDTREKSENIAL